MWKWFQGVGHTMKKWGIVLHRVAYSWEFLEIDFSMLSSQRLDMPIFPAPNTFSTFDKMTPSDKTMLWGVNKQGKDCYIMILMLFLSKILALIGGA